MKERYSYSIQAGKRIKQNLKNVNIEEYSDDNDEYVPSMEDNKDNEEITFYKRPKRKITLVVSPSRKNQRLQILKKSLVVIFILQYLQERVV